MEKSYHRSTGRKNPVGSREPRKYKGRYVWLNVLPNDLWLKVRQGTTIREALQQADLEVPGDCGGLGKCGKCKIRILSSIGPPSAQARELLDEEELARGFRLACRTRINKDLVIHLGETDSEADYHQILKTGHRPLLHPDPLVAKHLIVLPRDVENEALSDLDRIKFAMGHVYQDVKCSLRCLRTLPDSLRRTEFSGAAVFHRNELLAWQYWDEVNCYYGLAFDIGTSTLVGKLVNLTDGTEVAVVASMNSQAKLGTNVISRLQYIQQRRNGLEHLRSLLVGDLIGITTRLLKAAGLESDDVFIAVVAGNTTMQHILLGLNPSGIAEAPFAPVLTDGLVVKATEVGLRLNPEALLYVMPTKCAYIGGDLISVILASGATEQQDEIVLGMDLGTNGEIFLGNSRKMLTCSAAAGPAFEGASISRGMTAQAGAIEGVTFEDGSLHYEIIGNISPKGICGSGLVELVAVLLKQDIIDSSGLIRPPDDGAANGLSSRLVYQSGVYNFLIASAEESYDQRPIYLTQKDVRELQLAKAAIAAGIKTLMDEMGVTPDNIQKVYIAGALGNYISPHSAARIGLFPGLNPDMVTSLGNAASTGASMILLSKKYWQVANDLVDFIDHVELSYRIDFNEYFVENMDFLKQESPVDQLSLV
jgi:uncharacterized 2Fe-2S/4Fe-4S cluster protein (DUF4445 family)